MLRRSAVSASETDVSTVWLCRAAEEGVASEDLEGERAAR